VGKVGLGGTGGDAAMAIFHFFSLLQRKKRWILLINYDELLNAFF
jgi:hypothetical protein